MCMKCVEQGKMRIVGTPTDEEHKMYVLIFNKIRCAETMARIDVMPSDLSKEKIEEFVRCAVSEVAHNRIMMREWFEAQAKKYNEPDFTKLTYGDVEKVLYAVTQ